MMRATRRRFGPALEQCAASWTRSSSFLERIQSSRWETRLRYMLARRDEITEHVNRRRAQAAEGAAGGEEH